jgi:hypothetical protein
MSKKGSGAKRKSGRRTVRKASAQSRPRVLTMLGVGLAVVVVVVVGGFTWRQQPSSCSAACHSTMAPYYDSYCNPEMLAGLHAKARVACLDCHKPTGKAQLDEVKMQLSGSYPTPLPETEYPSTFCAGSRCHGQATLELVAKKTAGLQPNPHDSRHAPSATCTQCHNMHRR